MRRAVDGHGDGAFLLVALVGLHALRHLVLVVDLDGLDLVAVDAALGVDQCDVVVEARAQDRAHDLGGPGAVALHADDDVGLALGHRRHHRREDGGHDGQHRDQSDQGLAHTLSPFFAHLSTRTARRGSSCGCCARAGSVPPAPAPGTR